MKRRRKEGPGGPTGGWPEDPQAWTRSRVCLTSWPAFRDVVTSFVEGWWWMGWVGAAQ